MSMKISEICAGYLRHIALLRAIAHIVYGLTHRRALAFEAILKSHSALLIINRDLRRWLPVLRMQQIPTGSAIARVPVISLTEQELVTGLSLSPNALQAFREDGTHFIAERQAGAATDAEEWLRILRREGVAVMTREDAMAVLAAQRASSADRVYYTRRGWQAPVVRMAEALGVEQIFAVAEQVVRKGLPVLIIVTPGLPHPLRVWHVSVVDLFTPGFDPE